MQNLAEMLKESARHFPGKPAIVLSSGEEITYQYLDQMVDSAACSLRLKAGETVILMEPNSVDFIINAFAIARSGGIIVPVNPLYKREEVSRILQASGAKQMIVWQDRMPDLSDLAGNLTFHLRDLSTDAYTVRLDYQAPKVLPKNIVSMMFTTGTTGQPKAIPLLHEGFLAMKDKCAKIIPEMHLRVFSCFLPLTHVFGFTVNMVLPIAYGATILLSETFSLQALEKILGQLIRGQASLITGVPVIYQALAAALKKTNAQLNPQAICINGGDYLPPHIWRFFYDATGQKICTGYGLTETHSIVCFLEEDEMTDHLLLVPRWTTCVGKPIIATKIIGLRDPYGSVKQAWKRLPIGKEGEICFSTKDPCVCKGYLGDQAANEWCFSNHWFATGDVGYLDMKGNLYVTDRVKDIIIVSAANVSPREIEDVTLEFPDPADPAFSQAAAIGVPDPDKKRGQVIRLYVVPRPGKSFKEGDLRAFMRIRLHDSKIPHQIEMRETLPVVGLNKVDKRTLRAEIEQS